MRVLTRPNVGGPARQMAALWHACAARGWQTLLVVGVCDGEPEFDLQAAGVPRLAPDAVDLDSAGFVVVPSLRRGVRPWSDVLAEWRIGKLIEAFVPDVVHTHTSKAGALGRRAARDGDVPVVAHTFHGHVLRDYFGLWPSAVVRVAEWWLARRTDLLFAVSPSCRAELAAMRVAPAARIEVLPPAVDVRAFTGGPAVRARARARLGLQEGQFVLGFVGRLVPIKRPEAFAAVVARIADSVGLVFGDGPLRTEVEGVPRVRLLGAVPDLHELLPACDVLVLPSVREGLPLAAVEAFAAEVPVVGYDVPGVRDALAEWGHGVLVDEATGVEGLAEACAALRSAERRAAIAAAARPAVARFDPDAVAAQLVAAYERARGEVIRQRARRGATRAKPSVLDVVLLVPLTGLAPLPGAAACTTFAGGREVYAQAAAIGLFVLALVVWRRSIVRHRGFRQMLEAVGTFVVLGLAALACSAIRVLG